MPNSEMSYIFPGSKVPPLSEVGGKGLSLIEASNAGLPVPRGFILPVHFFDAWLTNLKASPQWADFLKSTEKNLKEKCDELKKLALQFSFADEQKRALDSSMQNFSKESVFAVRSSSPNEDLEGYSFAGGYETTLGADSATIETAIKKSFASCLDYRVVVYKHENGFDISDPKIAVVIQEQIISDIAGVGFSLNPISNNFDEAVINSNWGLGETVVSGGATPDIYIVDKVSMKIKNRQAGAKEVSTWINPSGAIEQKQKYRVNELTLTDSQVVVLSELIQEVEVLYNKPVDIEWAYAGGRLYLLQVRPITAYVPLIPGMMTVPGERKRLYVDLTISVQGVYRPISKMGTSIIEMMLREVGRVVFIKDIIGTKSDALLSIAEGRIYLNFSNVLELLGKARASRGWSNADPSASRVISQINESEYRAHNRKVRFMPLFLLIRLMGMAPFLLEAIFMPGHADKRVRKILKHFETKARGLAKKEMPFSVFVSKMSKMCVTSMFKSCIPLVATSRLALSEMKKLTRDMDTAEISKLELSLPNNPTTEMGLSLYKLSQIMPPAIGLKGLKQGLKDGTLPPGFMQAWTEFLDKYGHRGPGEIDIAVARYRDSEDMLVNLLIAMNNGAASENAAGKFREHEIAREKAFDSLYKKVRAKSWFKAKQFQVFYLNFKTLGGYRETPKFYLVFAIDLIRQRLLKESASFLNSQRLESLEQIFDLVPADVDKGISDPLFNLSEKAGNNTAFIRRLSRIPQLPRVIDSRGLILRPAAAPAIQGEIAGTPISSGIARGKVKILMSPDEKPFEKGEVLVARATDPAWTPLFINASAVILEVGGMLQHGALVAREYGLPCISGVEDAIKLFKDGMLVEVDGSSGIIRILETGQ